jgi:heptosyltransferase III
MKVDSILVIIQRSNGDVLFSLSLINALYEFFNFPKIDLLVNDDTIALARIFPNINLIHTFSYKEKEQNRIIQEKNIFTDIFRKYDLSINLTSSDRSVLYALLAAKKSISAIEKNIKKSWWKKLFLTHYYYFDNTKHILINNLEPLNILNINHEKLQLAPPISEKTISEMRIKLDAKGINNFVIFHPSAQYKYKIYPKHLRDELLKMLNSLNFSIVVTGSINAIDMGIKNKLPLLNNVIDFIGETSLKEYIALSHLSLAYIGMDTLNMHIAASQNKRVFAIFGPSNLSMWSPWSNLSQKCATADMPLQNYDNVTIFQANMPCVACGKAGCDDKHGKSECLFNINPSLVFQEIKKWQLGFDVEVIQ